MHKAIICANFNYRMFDMRLAGVILLFIFSITIARAENNVDLFVSGGLTTGGDTFAETNDGTKLKAGGLIYLAVGINLTVSQKLTIQSSLGYHFDSLDADNGYADYSRTFIDVLPFYKFTDTFRVGLGVSYIMSPEYDSSWNNVKFADTTSPILELNWRGATDSIWWGLRYSSTDLEVEKINNYSFSAEKLDGSYLGFMVHFYF